MLRRQRWGYGGRLQTNLARVAYGADLLEERLRWSGRRAGGPSTAGVPTSTSGHRAMSSPKRSLPRRGRWLRVASREGTAVPMNQ